MTSAVIERYVLDDIRNCVASADGGNVVVALSQKWTD
jgi:hypothetical protein